jgi:predicted porin
VGAYYAQSGGVNVQIEGQRVGISRADLRENVGTDAFADLAWQVIAGADYYWTPKFSTFIEYHFLDYTSDTLVVVRESGQRRFIRGVEREFDVNFDVKQHLVGAGVRFHF